MARRRASGSDLSHIAEALRPLAVPIGTLVHDVHQARIHPEDNAAAIEGSLRRFGQRQVIVYNPSLGNRVIAGNERLRIARDVLGWTHIAALAVEEDEQSSVGYAIADNRASELGGWNQAALEQAIRLIDPGMNEQLDRMAVKLAQDMRVAMPEMLEPTTPRQGRPSDTPEPEVGQSGEPAPSGPQGASGALEMRVGSVVVPLLPEEERSLLASIEAYRSQYQTLSGYAASLLELEAALAGNE